MEQKKTAVLIPSGEEFISNKEISDIVYAWILLNGDRDELGISIDQKPRGASKEIGIDIKTFYKRLERLEQAGYLIKDGTYKYYIDNSNCKYKRYIPKEILQKLYNTRMENIIKVYVYLGSLYDTNRKKGVETFFRYNTLVNMLGYYGGKNGMNRDHRNEAKVRGVVEKLAELGLITYTPRYIKTGSTYQVNLILNNVVNGKESE